MLTKKKYVNYHKKEIYAIYYKSNRTVYYNLNFSNKVKFFVLI